MKYIRSQMGYIQYRKQDLPADTVERIDKKGFAPHPCSTHDFRNTLFRIDLSHGFFGFNRTVHLRCGSSPTIRWNHGLELDEAWAHSGLCLAYMGVSMGFTDLIGECVLFLAPRIQVPVMIFLSDRVKDRLYTTGDDSMEKLDLVSVHGSLELKCLAPMRRRMNVCELTGRESMARRDDTDSRFSNDFCA